MKSISKILVTLLILLSQNINAQIAKAEIVATGLTCSMCSNAINKQLKKIPEVEKVTIDLNTNTFSISLKKGNQVSPKTLKECIQKAGFFVGSMEITFEVETKSLSKNYIFLDSEKTNHYKILDKGYVVMKDFKKLQKLYSKTASYLVDNEADFHLIATK
jgi:copper chaperone CopZ